MSWYVTTERAAVDWPTVSAGGVAQSEVIRLYTTTRAPGVILSELWRGKGDKLTAAQVTAAIADTSPDPIPAAPTATTSGSSGRRLFPTA